MQWMPQTSAGSGAGLRFDALQVHHAEQCAPEVAEITYTLQKVGPTSILSTLKNPGTLSCKADPSRRREEKMKELRSHGRTHMNAPGGSCNRAKAVVLVR